MSDLQPGEDGKVNTRNTMTGKIQRATPDQVSTSEYLQVVADDAKPFEPGLFRPGKVGEFDNVEPLTDAQIAAQDELDAVLEDHGPRSKVAQEAKAKVAEADENATPPEGATTTKEN